MTKRFWQWLVLTNFKVMSRLPRSFVHVWTVGLVALSWRFIKRYRVMADKNLKIAYGDRMTAAERNELTRRVFRHFAHAISDFLKAPSMTPEQVKALVKVDSFAPMDDLLARGKGLIFITAHIGNWELLARRAAIHGTHITVVARQGDDPAFNALTDHIRESGGYSVHPRGDSPRALLKVLRSNAVIGILPDQKSDDVFVPFFGQLAGTVAGPAVLALKTGAAILPVFCIRQPDGTYQTIHLPEIDTHSTDNQEADIWRITADITAAVESIVRQYPDQWLWLHDRWKMPPPEIMPKFEEKLHFAQEAAAAAPTR